MNIIIDAYNLLKQALQKDHITQKERTWFLSRAAEYAKRKGHKLYVVFDGGFYDRPSQEKKGSLVVIYSGTRLTADEVIQGYIEEKVIRNMLLVSTDRQLNAIALQHHVPCIDSLDFYRFMQQKPPTLGLKKAPGKAHKLHKESSAELDVLMEEGASMVYHKEEDQPALQEQQKKSRKERLMLDILKKL